MVCVCVVLLCDAVSVAVVVTRARVLCCASSGRWVEVKAVAPFRVPFLLCDAVRETDVKLSNFPRS